MIFSSKLRWNFLFWVSQVSHRTARALQRRPWKVVYGRVWLGMAGLLLLLSILLTLPHTSIDSTPVLSYEQIGSAQVQVRAFEPQAAGPAVLSAGEPCSMLFHFLKQCKP